MKKSDQNSEKNPDQNLKSKFLYPIKAYYGHFSPEKLIFNANLQEFAQRVDYIAGLHTNGKLSSRQACQQLEDLWLQLQQSKNLLE